jgi:hypothetical protein
MITSHHPNQSQKGKNITGTFLSCLWHCFACKYGNACCNKNSCSMAYVGIQHIHADSMLGNKILF